MAQRRLPHRGAYRSHARDRREQRRARARRQRRQPGEQRLQVNLDAATEVGRQLRLRDMGGIIVVDFIDLHNPNNRKALYEKLRTEMKRDRAKHNHPAAEQVRSGADHPAACARRRISPPSRSVRPAKERAIKASILLIDEIENNLRHFVQEQNEKQLHIQVHPYLEAYLNKGLLWNSMVHQWKKKFKAKIP